MNSYNNKNHNNNINNNYNKTNSGFDLIVISLVCITKWSEKDVSKTGLELKPKNINKKLLT